MGRKLIVFLFEKINPDATKCDFSLSVATYLIRFVPWQSCERSFLFIIYAILHFRFLPYSSPRRVYQ